MKFSYFLILAAIVLVSLYSPIDLYVSSQSTNGDVNIKHKTYNSEASLSDLITINDSIGTELTYTEIDDLDHFPIKILPFGQEDQGNSITVYYSKKEYIDQSIWLVFYQSYDITREYEIKLHPINLAYKNEYFTLESEGSINSSLSLTIKGLCPKSKTDEMISAALDSAFFQKIEEEIRKQLLKHS